MHCNVVFGAANQSRTGDLVLTKDALYRLSHSSTFWQGQKDLNPRHAVLETAALPTELCPYIGEQTGIKDPRFKFVPPECGGPSGTRTRDRPVMSRLL